MKRLTHRYSGMPLPVALALLGCILGPTAPGLLSQSLSNQPALPPAGVVTPSTTGSTSTGPKPTDTREGVVLLPELAATVDSASPLVRPDLPQEVIQKIRRFESFREQYLRRRAELYRLYRGATEEERAKLRLRLQLLHQEWQQRATEVLQQARERRLELRDKLPSLREPLQDALREARERAVEQAQENKKRPGED